MGDFPTTTELQLLTENEWTLSVDWSHCISKVIWREIYEQRYFWELHLIIHTAFKRKKKNLNETYLGGNLRSCGRVDSCVCHCWFLWINVFLIRKKSFSRFLGSSPACVQSWDAEREMVPRRLRFSLGLVENSPSLGRCEWIRAYDWPSLVKVSNHWINALSVSARRHAYLASGWWLVRCFKALHWRINVLSSPAHHLMFDVANYTLTSVHVSRSL